MTIYEEQVEEFHRVMELPLNSAFTKELLVLRRRVLEEEVKELFQEVDASLEAIEKGEEIPKAVRTNMLKELADVQYALTGFSLTFGLPTTEVFSRVHKSNMSKLGEDGKPVKRADGKVTKGPNYHPPVLDDLVK